VVRSFWQLLACRALVGIGEAGYSPAAQALIAEFYRGKQRAFAIGIYSVGMAVGGIVGIWVGGELDALYGWRVAFLAMGAPGLVLAVLASRLREPSRRPPTPVAATLQRWLQGGARRAARVAAPLIAFTLGGALLSAFLGMFDALPPNLDTAVFGIAVSAGIAWTVVRLVPIALAHRAEVSGAAHTAVEDFRHAAVTVLRTPTLIWMFVGGAFVTFAVNGLIAWSPTFLERTHGLSIAEVGRAFGLWGLAGSGLGVLFGGKVGGPVCAGLLLLGDLRFFVPLLFATFFLYTWYSGPLSAVILDVVPPAIRASVLGAFVLFSHLAGDAIAPPLIGYLSDRVGLRPAMLLLPMVGVVGGLLILIALTTVGRDMARVKA